MTSTPKSVESTLLDRRSIRRYEREAISPQDLDFIHQAIINTPTSYNGQQFTVIDVADQALKEKLYELTNQKQIKTCNHFMVFCADYNKITLAAQAKGVEMPPFAGTVDGLIVGTVDAALAMMSAVAAAESRGLGTCCIGYTRTANPAAISELLGLPESVYIVCGLAIGIPRELPDLKPKQPASLIIHHDNYRSDSEALTNELLEYDRIVTDYNATRSGTKSSNDWVDHIIDYYREAMSYDLAERLSHRGFLTTGK